MVELNSHVAELRYDWVVLMGQRICYLAVEISLRSEIARKNLHATYVPKLASNASHKVVLSGSVRGRISLGVDHDQS
ncbi:hypothetical protein [Methylorubrum extorquens]|uniref:hypothetical protein n=1 Tax=Methylorubrum extorquens TaxID=408 RepID=UPI001EE5E7C5|nr:hypothetical protein [Methylorubrum extorquens]MCG5249624.1 hypothetical protein [Methylorubrum extorquens]